MAKIERKYMAHFLNASFGQAAGTASYERLGQDLEEYSAEMNAQVDTTNNILGQKSIKISSYDKSGSVEPYYADKDSPLFEKLQEIIDGDLLLDDLKTDIVEVHLWETRTVRGLPRGEGRVLHRDHQLRRRYDRLPDPLQRALHRCEDQGDLQRADQDVHRCGFRRRQLTRI